LYSSESLNLVLVPYRSVYGKDMVFHSRPLIVEYPTAVIQSLKAIDHI